MYEMLKLYEEALVQYDELDALLTQFVVNFAAGGKHYIFVILWHYEFASQVTL